MTAEQIKKQELENRFPRGSKVIVGSLASTSYAPQMIVDGHSGHNDGVVWCLWFTTQWQFQFQSFSPDLLKIVEE